MRRALLIFVVAAGFLVIGTSLVHAQDDQRWHRVPRDGQLYMECDGLTVFEDVRGNTWVSEDGHFDAFAVGLQAGDLITCRCEDHPPETTTTTTTTTTTPPEDEEPPPTIPPEDEEPPVTAPPVEPPPPTEPPAEEPPPATVPPEEPEVPEVPEEPEVPEKPPTTPPDDVIRCVPDGKGSYVMSAGPQAGEECLPETGAADLLAFTVFGTALLGVGWSLVRRRAGA